MNVRPYQARDGDNVRRICIETGPQMPVSPEKSRNVLLTTFCDYYIEQEPESCFVLTDEADEAVGYILCAKNAEAWAARLREEYFSRMGFIGRVICKSTTKQPLKYAHNYPAHLHIDILPPYQGKGLGKDLLNALVSHLREAGVPGLMLGVDPKNVNAIKFYKKYGFKELDAKRREIIMGLDL